MNYYEVLEISKNSSPEVIKAAYRALAKKYHPDSYHGKDQKEKMALINTAYAVLSDTQKRRDYDRTLEGNMQGASGFHPYENSSANDTAGYGTAQPEPVIKPSTVVFGILYVAAIGVLNHFFGGGNDSRR